MSDSSFDARLWSTRIGLMLLSPLVAFALVEGVLRLSGSGYTTDFFVPAVDATYLKINPDFTRRWFPKRLARAADPQFIKAQKARGALRVFVLGASAANGFPAPSYSIGRYLEAMLNTTYPDREIEVINASMAAINSHVIREIAMDCLDLEPDLFVVMTGNNEVVGPYGAGCFFQGHVPALWRIRLATALKATRTGQAVAAWRESRNEAPSRSWQGMEMFVRSAVDYDSAKLLDTYRYYGQNMDAICEASRARGVPFIVVTMPTNLRDSPPFKSTDLSRHSPSAVQTFTNSLNASKAYIVEKDYAAALPLLRKAVGVIPSHALTHYLLGSVYEAMGAIPSAYDHYTLARDRDRLRFRADSTINDTIRAVAARQEGALLFDAEKAITLASRNTIPGAPHFLEHVHLTPQGNYLLASKLWPTVQDLLLGETAGHVSFPAPDAQRCNTRLALSLFAEDRILSTIFDTMSRAPFSAQYGHAQRMNALLDRLAASRTRAFASGQIKTVLGLFGRAAGQYPGDVYLSQDYAQFEADSGRPKQAELIWRGLLKRDPDALQWRLLLIASLEEQGRFKVAETMLAEAQALMEPASYLGALGTLQIKMEEYEGALGSFQDAVALDPDALETVANLGLTLFHSGKQSSAVKLLRASLERVPDNTFALEALGFVLRERGELQGAADAYHRALAILPRDIESMMGLAEVHARRNALSDARALYERVLRLEPNHLDACTQQAWIQWVQKDRHAAIVTMRRAVSLNPDDTTYQNMLARFLAVTPSVSNADRSEAASIATRLCEQSDWEVLEFKHTLALALAANGEFARASELVQQVVQLARQTGQKARADAAQRQLALFAKGQPYIE